jgi:hypothetical protein
VSEPPLRSEPTAIPPELDRWNWGAFLLNWIWGVGNNTYIALLTFIPLFGILIMPFVLGAKGSRWAWRNGRWDSIEHFKRMQRLWAIWAVVIWVGAITLFGGSIGGVYYALGHSEAYQLGTTKLRASTLAVSILGEPIATGMPFGSISVSPGSGKAVISFSATGPKSAGVVFLEAIKTDGAWSITRLTLKINGRDGVIDLVNGSRNNTT